MLLVRRGDCTGGVEGRRWRWANQAKCESECEPLAGPVLHVPSVAALVLLQVDMSHTVNQFYFDEIPLGGEALCTITCSHDPDFTHPR